MSDPATPLNPARRRRALAWGHVNGGLWAIGNTLSTGPLVIYLASDLGAQGLGLSLVLATPNLAGLLRLAAPAVIYRAGTARRACLTLSSASYVLIAGLPLIAALAPAFPHHGAVAAMIALVFAHQLLEYLGTVALWSWWGDLVPERIRGRYFARRQIVQLSTSIPTFLVSGYFADAWRQRNASDSERLLLAYAIPIGVGAAFLLASLVPLVRMPATRRYPRPDTKLVWSTIVAPFVDRRFVPLLVFRSWFSLANGVTQVVQSAIFPKSILGFGVGPMNALRVVTSVGQLAGSRLVGKWSDRFGNRPVLMAAQACVSLSLLFFLIARPETRWLIAGASVLFAAYVAHNICLPNLTLKLSPELQRPGYVAAGEALGSLFHAAATVAGGLLFDALRGDAANTSPAAFRSCLAIFVIGLLMRSFGVLLLTRIREPSAWNWRQILAARGPGAVEPT